MTPASLQSESRVVRKAIDPDCLLDGELHPSIRMRLERVRELPVKGVANLRGVERTAGGDVVAVWEFVEGKTLKEMASSGAPRERVERIVREAELIVAAMHGAGIVHGAVHERNIIVSDDGEVKLTHVSPLLFHDEQVDLDALAELRGRLLPNSVARPSAQEDVNGAGLRRRAVVAAVVVAATGLAMAATIGWYLTQDEGNQMTNDQIPMANK